MLRPWRFGASEAADSIRWTSCGASTYGTDESAVRTRAAGDSGASAVGTRADGDSGVSAAPVLCDSAMLWPGRLGTGEAAGSIGFVSCGAVAYVAWASAVRARADGDSGVSAAPGR